MTDKRKISELIPDHANANKGTERGRYALEASLRQYGAGRSILLDKNGRIIAGNKTAEVAADVGLDDVLVVQTDGKQIVAVQRTDLDIDSEAGRGLAYADNRVGQLSLDWDAEQVLADLNAGMDLSGMWKQDELDELLTQIEEPGDSLGSADVARMSLSERFLIPPFSVLDARQGYWQNRKSAWLALGIQSELGRNINALGFSETAMLRTGGTSIFDPVLCEIAYSWFCPPKGAILDPFAGGSVRGIVASYLGRKYTGVDLRAEQIAANVEQAKRLVPDNQPLWIVGDSNVALPNDTFDFVFSCPPYADLEVYSDNQQDISTMDYPEFLAVYRSIVRQSVERLANNRFACFVVGDVRDKNGIYRNFVSDTIAAFQDTGAMLYNEAILVTAVGSLPIRVGKQFVSGRKLGKTHQNALVFVKGNPRKAAEACGVIEIADLYSTDDVGT